MGAIERVGSEAVAAVASLVEAIKTLDPLDRETSLTAYFSATQSLPAAFEFAGELPPALPVKAIGACLAYGIYESAMEMLGLIDDFPAEALPAVEALAVNLASFMLVVPSKSAHQQQMDRRQLVELLGRKLRFSRYTAAALCAAFDPYLENTALPLFRNQTFKLVTALAEVNGVGAEEGALRMAIDQTLADAAEDVRKHYEKVRIAGLKPSHFRPNRTAPTGEVSLEDARAELNQLIGLSNVKSQIEQLVAFLSVQEKRKAKKLTAAGQTLHFVFTGNPGTGKTSVARVLGRVLCALKIIERPEVLECTRADLVAGYVGQTAMKTTQVVERARGGILFIDEAYTLSSRGADGDYGTEAIDALLKKMEDYRDQLVVVVAGYPELMVEFVESNPGLKSRFTRYIVFEDYKPGELCQIFESFCERNDYRLDTLAKARISILMADLCQHKLFDFANARLVRNLFDESLNAHAMRVAGIANPSEQMLTELTGADISFVISPELTKQPPDLEAIRWSVACPKCGQAGRVPLAMLGKTVTCKKCAVQFVCPWYEIAQ